MQEDNLDDLACKKSKKNHPTTFSRAFNNPHLEGSNNELRAEQPT